MFDFAPFEVDTFSGGITDFIVDAPANRAERLDNLEITDAASDGKRKLKTRAGRSFLDALNPQLPLGNVRPGALIRHPLPAILSQVGRSLYYAGPAWTELLGPSLNPVLGLGDPTNFVAWDTWRNHVLIGNDAFSDPMKVYQDGAGQWQVRSAALPGLDLEAALDVANDLRAKLNGHVTDVTEHTVADIADQVATAPCYDEASLIALVTVLLTKYAAHEADAALAGGRLYHAAQEGASHALSSVVAPLTVLEARTRLLDLAAKFNAHDADATAHPAASSLYQTTAVLDPTITGVAGPGAYLYRFNYAYTYTVGDVTYVDRGPTREVPVANVATAQRNIADIPQLHPAPTRNHDTVKVVVEISRTINGGQKFYLFDSVPNGTTVYVDTMTDVDLQLRPSLYTEGGNLDRDPAPRCKALMVVDNRAYYLNLIEGAAHFPNRFRQSNPNDIFAAPAGNNEDLDAEIVGGSSVGQYPIIFCVDRAYRVEGAYDAAGRGQVKPIEIPGRKGAINHHGIVRIPGGIIYPSDDAFWYTDGFQTFPISLGLTKTYKRMTSTAAKKARIQGYYDRYNNSVKWQVQMHDSSGDCDATLVLDLKQGLSTDMPFYTHSGGEKAIGNWAVTSMADFAGTTVMADKRGFILKYDPLQRVDPKIDVTKPTSQWVNQTIFWEYRSPAFSCGSSLVRKASPKINVKAENRGDIAIELSVSNDRSGTFKSMKPVRSASSLPWGKPKVPWGTAGIRWGVAKAVMALRNIPMSMFRFDYRQVRITNAQTIVANSDTFGTATLAAAAKTLTLPAGANLFPADSVDYFLSFDNDGYMLQYRVAAIDPTRKVLTYFDPKGTAVSSATRKWQLQGYRKRDYLELLSYSFPVALLTAKQKSYSSAPAATGANQ